MLSSYCIQLKRFLRTFPYSWVSVGLFFNACALGPEHSLPIVRSNVPLATPTMLSSHIQAKAHTISWRNYFTDPRLKTLIEAGLKNNYEVRKAMLNLKAARAEYGLDIYHLIPNFHFDGVSKSRTGSFNRTYTQHVIQQGYTSGLGVTRFELDIYKKFDQGRAAEHALKASYYDQVKAKITLIASIAKKYFMVRTNEELLKNALKTLAYQKELYRIQTLRNKAGILSDLELLKHRTALDRAQAIYLDRKQNYANSLDEMAILIGSPLSELQLPQGTALTTQFNYLTWPQDIPSEVMLYRPDIRAMEERLQQSAAEVRVARAAFFPHIILNGAITAAAPHLSSLFHTGQMHWDVGSSLSIPVLDIFPNVTNLKLAKIKKEALILEYQHAVQQAFFEVVTALQVYQRLDAQYKLAYSVMLNTKKVRDLTRLKFNQGVTDRDEMLDVENQFIQSQNDFLTRQQIKLFNQVDLYTTLGGGIDEIMPKTTEKK
ncbi:MAG: TolC family protein [Neisseriaceae bacterium]